MVKQQFLQIKSCFIFISSFFFYTHFQQEAHTHGTASGVPPISSCRQLQTRLCFYSRTSAGHKEALSEEKQHGFCWAEGRPKPPVPVPLPAFPPCDFSCSPQHRQGCFRKSTPPLHSSVSCRQLWLQLLQNVMTLQVSPSCPQSLSTSPSRGATQVGADAVATSQPWLLAGINQEERRSTQEGLPSCAIATTSPSWKKKKTRRISAFWEAPRIFLHLPTGGAVGQTLAWTLLEPSQPTNSRLSVQNTHVQLGKANFKAV